jgi:tetratricopeptide (TPR) repeat protein
MVGLEPIVAGIRAQSETRSEPIGMLFCPSNIPDEFDEDAILRKLLQEAAKRLGYARPAKSQDIVVEIHHWSLMDLLEQPLVAERRPRSRLATEYGKLRTYLTALNLKDRDGALVAMNSIGKSYDRASQYSDSETIEILLSRASKIGRLHPDDPMIATKGADLFLKAGDFERAESLLSYAIEAKHRSPRNLLRRAIARNNLDRKADALEDIELLLRHPEGTPIEFTPAIQILRRTAGNPVETAFAIFQDANTNVDAKLQLFWVLMSRHVHLDAIAAEIRRCMEVEERSWLEMGSGEETEGAKERPWKLLSLANALRIVLIAGHRFSEAMEPIPAEDAMDNPAPEFNRLMASWGAHGYPEMSDVTSFDSAFSELPTTDANALQCFALVKALLGESEMALELLARAEKDLSSRALVFSCWTYLNKEGAEFAEDIRDMREAITSDSPLLPPFLNIKEGATTSSAS